MKIALALTLSLAACSGGAEDTGWGEGPDVTGQYNAFLEEATGCQGDYSWVQDWSEGPLKIEGPGPRDLVFTFRNDMSFNGQVQSSWSYQFGGSQSWGTGSISVYQSGMFDSQDDRLVMTGSYEILVDENGSGSTDCTLTARMEAFQIAR